MACSAAERMFDSGAFTTMTPAPGGRLDVDVVEPDAGPAHHDEVGAGLEDLGGHLGGRADDEGVGAGDGAEQRLGRRGRAGRRPRGRRRPACSSPRSASFSVMSTRAMWLVATSLSFGALRGVGCAVLGAVLTAFRRAAALASALDPADRGLLGGGEELAEAGDALDDGVVAERVGQAQVAGGAERLSGHHGHLGLVDGHLGHLGRRDRPSRPASRRPSSPAPTGRRRRRPRARRRSPRCTR